MRLWFLRRFLFFLLLLTFLLASFCFWLRIGSNILITAFCSDNFASNIESFSHFVIFHHNSGNQIPFCNIFIYLFLNLIVNRLIYCWFVSFYLVCSVWLSLNFIKNALVIDMNLKVFQVPLSKLIFTFQEQSWWQQKTLSSLIKLNANRSFPTLVESILVLQIGQLLCDLLQLSRHYQQKEWLNLGIRTRKTVS